MRRLFLPPVLPMHRLIRFCCLPLLLAPALAMAQGFVQNADPGAPVSNEVHKCVRAGEVFYTNGACPAGTSEARLGQGTPAARRPVMRAEPLPGESAARRAEPVQRMAPPPRQASVAPAPAEPVFQSSLKTVRASELVPPPTRAPESEWRDAGGGQGFRPLSSFPPLPESGGARASSGGDGAYIADESAAREAPVRAPVKYAAEPVADARASNNAMCGFVHAELQRLDVEAQAATAEDAKARIAGHRKRLHERQAQLKC